MISQIHYTCALYTGHLPLLSKFSTGIFCTTGISSSTGVNLQYTMHVVTPGNEPLTHRPDRQTVNRSVRLVNIFWSISVIKIVYLCDERELTRETTDCERVTV